MRTLGDGSTNGGRQCALPPAINGDGGATMKAARTDRWHSASLRAFSVDDRSGHWRRRLSGGMAASGERERA
jgi:hypothetical protein